MAGRPEDHVAGVEPEGIVVLLGGTVRKDPRQIPQRVLPFVVERRFQDLLAVDIEKHFGQAVHVFIEVVQPQVQPDAGGVASAPVGKGDPVSGWTFFWYSSSKKSLSIHGSLR